MSVVTSYALCKLCHRRVMRGIFARCSIASHARGRTDHWASLSESHVCPTQRHVADGEVDRFFWIGIVLVLVAVGPGSEVAKARLEVQYQNYHHRPCVDNARRWILEVNMSRALRLRLYVEGDTLRLRSVRRVEMVVPPSDPIPTADKSGFWVEIRDKRDRSLYRRVLGDVLQDTIEVFSNDPNETVARRPRPPGQTEFVVVVPDTPEASSVVFFGTRYAEGRPLGPAQEIARFDVRLRR
jgi:hypothetical protein